MANFWSDCMGKKEVRTNGALKRGGKCFPPYAWDGGVGVAGEDHGWAKGTRSHLRLRDSRKARLDVGWIQLREAHCAWIDGKRQVRRETEEREEAEGGDGLLERSAGERRLQKPNWLREIMREDMSLASEMGVDGTAAGALNRDAAFFALPVSRVAISLSSKRKNAKLRSENSKSKRRTTFMWNLLYFSFPCFGIVVINLVSWPGIERGHQAFHHWATGPIILDRCKTFKVYSK